MKHLSSILGAAALLFAGLTPVPSFSAEQAPGKTAPGMTADVKPATFFTAKANASVYGELDFGDRQEHEFATRGLIDAPEKLELKNESGRIIWSQAAYAFLDTFKKAPDSANPSLWENTINNHAYGLFKVVDGIYQVARLRHGQSHRGQGQNGLDRLRHDHVRRVQQGGNGAH